VFGGIRICTDAPQYFAAPIFGNEVPVPVKFGASVGRRLFFMVACEIAVAALLVWTALKESRTWMFTVAIIGTAVVLLLGLHVRKAITRRIHSLVVNVRFFQESGVYARIADPGRDDIAVLSNALDAGLYAIASREKDREQFLSMAAHELRTPVTSIRGFASMLLNRPMTPSETRRALETINRQSWRLGRLIEALFLAMQARSGGLHFDPKPFNLSLLVQRVLKEMEAFIGCKSFCTHVQENVSVLGDEALLEHALWCLFACATALSSENEPVRISFGVEQWASLKVDLKKTDLPIPDIQELFLPSRAVEYRVGTGDRLRIGLYLCREIVRVHNGRLEAHQVSDKRPEFVLELPT
jgi:signal transduction histidine kinase